MTDFYTPFIVITLIAVIVIQAIERYMFSEQTQRDRAKLIAAVLAKNMNEYTDAVKTEKEPAPAFDPGSDEVDLSDASDESFNKYIKNGAR